MVMEFLEGQTLHEVLHYEGPLPYGRVCTIAAQIASALHAAHEIGIIHRDIKPANITILKTPHGDVAKVLDFGIAKLKEAHIDHAFENDFTLTSAGMVVGTPAYVSPEQAMGKRGSELDGRSDVYSFAVVVYQMLTNKLPVQADSEEQFVIAHATIPPDDITNYVSHLPPPVAELIMRCLSKDPNDRPSDPRVLTDEMQDWDKLNEHPTPVSQPQAAPSMLAEQEEPSDVVRAVPRWLIFSLLGSLLLFTVAAISFFRHRSALPAETERGQTSLIQPSSLTLLSGDMILIPSGAAMLGEHNHMQQIRAFYIDKTEVSTRAYLDFCQKTHHAPPPDIAPADADLPIRNVTYSDASAFAAWAHKRLPTAAEWEKAARGTQGQHFPWGNDLGTGMANLPLTPEQAQNTSLPDTVNSYPQGDSSYGVRNMVGNVWEWVAASPVQIRGGSYQSYPPTLNQSFESLVFSGQTIPADTKRPDIGFRCAR
jgi:serine/threonine-protein kinase